MFAGLVGRIQSKLRKGAAAAQTPTKSKKPRARAFRLIFVWSAAIGLTVLGTLLLAEIVVLGLLWWFHVRQTEHDKVIDLLAAWAGIAGVLLLVDLFLRTIGRIAPSKRLKRLIDDVVETPGLSLQPSGSAGPIEVDRHSAMSASLVVGSPDDLCKLSCRGFLERDLLSRADKFRRRDNETAKATSNAWNDYKKALVYPSGFWDKVREMVQRRDSWAIVGDAGVGKSAYMLLTLDAALKEKETLKPWFEKVVFLNAELWTDWKADLERFNGDRDKILVVVDAPFRSGDDEQMSRAKALALSDIQRGFEEQGEEGGTVGPFCLLLTLRREDHTELLNADPLRPPSLKAENLRWDPNLLWLILRHYLTLYQVSLEPPELADTGSPQFLASGIPITLVEKSGGLALYCEELVRFLEMDRKPFTSRALDEFPPGVGNLYFHVLEKMFPESIRETALNLVALLASKNHAFSEGFFYHIREHIVAEAQRHSMREQWNKFELHYMASERGKDGEERNLAGRRFLRLDSPHLARTLEQVAAQPTSLLNDGTLFLQTRRLFREAWHNLPKYKGRIETSLRGNLEAGANDVGDFLLLADLARLGEHSAEEAARLWRSEPNPTALGKLPERDLLTREFYEVIADYGLRAMQRQAVEDARKWLRLAFDIILDKKVVMAFASFLRVTILPQADTQEKRDACVNEINQLYQKILDANPEDVRALTARAKLWWVLGDHEKARADLERLGDAEKCLKSYEMSAAKTEPDSAGGFASLRNALNEAKQLLKLNGDSLRHFQARMSEWSKRAYDLEQANWKNCSDYGEDLLTEANRLKFEGAAGSEIKFGEALAKFQEGWSLYKAAVKALVKKDRTGALRWGDKHNRKTTNHFMWGFGKAYLGLGNHPLGKRFMWIGARLEDQPSGWFELALIEAEKLSDAEGFRGAFEKWLLSRPLSNGQQPPKRLRRVLSLARDLYARLGMSEEAALAALYSGLLPLPRVRLASASAQRISKGFGVVGNWLLKQHTLSGIGIALECCLISLRLGQDLAQMGIPEQIPGTEQEELDEEEGWTQPPRARAGPSDPLRLRIINLLHLRRAAEILQRTWLANELLKEVKGLEYGSGREASWIEDSTAKGAASATAARSKLDEAIVSEVRGDWTRARSFYLELVDGQWDQLLGGACSGLSQAEALRIAIAALIARGDWDSALRGCEKLKHCVKSPEDVFVECLAWKVRNPVKSSP